MRTPCAIVGSGNIGTDLMYKLVRSPVLDLRLVSGIDPTSDGLRRARALDVETSVLGAGAIFDRPEDYPIVFEATSASIHKANAAQYAIRGVQAIDLTPARVGPLVVP